MINNCIAPGANNRTYIYYDLCNVQIPKTRNERCNKCNNEVITRRQIGRNMEDGDDEGI